jgi:invasion protein IalB
MRRVAACLFYVLGFAGFATTPATSEEAKPPAVTISLWNKFCFDETCFTGADIKAECEVLASVALIEQTSEAKKILRIAVPTHVKRGNGLSLAIDQAQPIRRPFDPCDPISCSATYEAGPELVDQLKHGQTLTLSAVDDDNSAIRLTLPLASFAKAYDGPSTPTKVFEVQEKKLSEELERRANEARDQVARGQEVPKQEPPKPHCASQN